MGTSERVVLHVDMDAFFASVAQRDDPSLRGKAVIVGGHSVQRGVVCSCSYEARAFGVRNAMAMAQAYKLCPTAIAVPVDFEAYRMANMALREVWARYSPQVEVASFDEAYLDLTGAQALMGPPLDVARRLQAEIRADLDLPCSVGVGPNKLLAKVASKRGKPAGLCQVTPGQAMAWLAPLAVRDLHGIGEATAARLARLGITRVHQMQAIDEASLVRALGPGADHLARMAGGEDDRPLSPGAPAKSIGAERTFDGDLADDRRLRGILYDLVQEVAFRARKAHVVARTVAVKIRYADFETLERERTLAEGADQDRPIAETALALLKQHATPGRPLRLLGVRLSNFRSAAQLSWLAPEREQHRKLDAELDRLRERHGLYVVSRGTRLERRS